MALPMPVPPRGMPLGNAPQPEPSAEGMMAAEQPQMGPDVQQLKTQFLSQVRSLVQMVDSLSSTYPAFAPHAEQIMEIAQQGMIQVVSALGAQEPTVNPLAMM